MELIIGREPSKSCLSVTVDGSKMCIGREGSVPKTISRTDHCKIELRSKGDCVIYNLKDSNITEVNGKQIVSRKIDIVKDKVTLGSDKFPLDIVKILAAVTSAAEEPEQPVRSEKPQGSVDLSYLAPVWKSYEREKEKIENRRERRPLIQRSAGILTAISVGCAFIPSLAAFRFPLIIVSVVLSITFVVYGLCTVGSFRKELKEAEEKLASQYKCPQCGASFGKTDFEKLKVKAKVCNKCKTKFEY